MPNNTTDALTLDLVTLTADIVAAYAAGNHIAASELPKVITAVHGALIGLAQPQAAAPAEEPAEQPTAREIRKSITPDALISFIDGKPYVMLKRHLRGYGISAADYRRRYGLPDDYPMTAANYSAMRSALAKSTGLGQLGGQARRQAAEQDRA